MFPSTPAWCPQNSGVGSAPSKAAASNLWVVSVLKQLEPCANAQVLPRNYHFCKFIVANVLRKCSWKLDRIFSAAPRLISLDHLSIWPSKRHCWPRTVTLPRSVRSASKLLEDSALGLPTGHLVRSNTTEGNKNKMLTKSLMLHDITLYYMRINDPNC